MLIVNALPDIPSPAQRSYLQNITLMKDQTLTYVRLNHHLFFCLKIIEDGAGNTRLKIYDHSYRSGKKMGRITHVTLEYECW